MRAVGRWKAADAPRRACLVLGALITAFGVAQFVAIAILSALFAVVANGLAAEGLPSALHGNQAPFDLLLKLGVAWQVLLVAQIAAGIAGMFLYSLARPLAAQVVVVAAAGCTVAAAIVRIDFGGINMLSLRQMIYPGGGVIAVPFCVALAVVAMLVRRSEAAY